MTDNKTTVYASTPVARLPEVKMPLPGPKAKALIERDTAVMSTSYTRDYPFVMERGEGCIVWDVDGNRFLDIDRRHRRVRPPGTATRRSCGAIQEQADALLHMAAPTSTTSRRSSSAERLAASAPGPGTEAGVLRQLRHRGRRGRDQAGALPHRAAPHDRLLRRVPRPHHTARCRSPPQKPSSAQRLLRRRSMPGVSHCRPPMGVAEDRTAEIDRLHRQAHTVAPPGKWRRSSSSRSRARAAMWCRRPASCRACASCATARHPAGRRRGADRHGPHRQDVRRRALGRRAGHRLPRRRASRAACRWARSSRAARSWTGRPASHGSTFGGNPVACAAALATIDLLENGVHGQRRRRCGEHCWRACANCSRSLQVIGDVRGLGLMTRDGLIEAAQRPSPAGTAQKIVEPAFAGPADPRLRQSADPLLPAADPGEGAGGFRHRGAEEGVRKVKPR